MNESHESVGSTPIKGIMFKKIVLTAIIIIFLAGCGDICNKQCDPGYHCEMIADKPECVTDPLHTPKPGPVY